MSNTDGLLFDNDPRTRTYTGAFDFPPEDVGGGTGGGNEGNDGNNGGGSSPGSGDGPITPPGNGEGGRAGLFSGIDDSAILYNNTPNNTSKSIVKMSTIGSKVASRTIDTATEPFKGTIIPVKGAVEIYVEKEDKSDVTVELRNSTGVLLVMNKSGKYSYPIASGKPTLSIVPVKNLPSYIPEHMRMISGEPLTVAVAPVVRASTNIAYYEYDLAKYTAKPTKAQIDAFIAANTGKSFYAVAIKEKAMPSNVFLNILASSNSLLYPRFEDIFTMSEIDGAIVKEFEAYLQLRADGTTQYLGGYNIDYEVEGIGLLSEIGLMVLPNLNKDVLISSSSPTRLAIESVGLLSNKFNIYLDGVLKAEQVFLAEPFFIDGLTLETAYKVKFDVFTPTGKVFSYEKEATTSSSLIEDFEDTTYNIEMTGNWIRTTAQKYQGRYSLKNKAIGDNGVSTQIFTFKVTSNSKLSFWYKASTEAGYDKLIIKLDNNQIVDGSGDTGWVEYVSNVIPRGDHVLEVSYVKDGSGANSDDSVYIDMIKLEEVK